jgi:uncharacterized membrane protein
MSDVRFIMVGIVLVFLGFLILGVFGGNYNTSNIETSEFGNCFDYSNSEKPIPIDCSEKMQGQIIFFGIIIILIAIGVISLVKGVRGDWDSRVKPEDMVGPSRDNHID